jgi:hypothetical protein
MVDFLIASLHSNDRPCNLDISHSWVPNCELEYDLCQKDVLQEAEAKVQVVVVVVVVVPY